MKNFGDRLKAFRKRAGLTQEQIAEAVGLTKSAVSQWESNASQPDIPSLKVLRDVLGVSLDVLICGDAPDGAGDALSPSERVLLQRFRNLPPKKRESAANLLEP
jgi:transcriptional regulator with XRE-family HTH domain